MECGALFAMTRGTPWMLQSYVDNWVTLMLVRTLYHAQTSHNACVCTFIEI